MKKSSRPGKLLVRERDEVLPEYDFTRARRNTYAARYAEGANVVVIDPDVAKVFRNAEQVNSALRALAELIRRHRGKTRTRRRA
jgi:hypothetical protein